MRMGGIHLQVVILSLTVISTFGDKFLVIHTPYSGSHPWHVLPVTREMLVRGHTVTTIIYKAEHNFKWPDLGENHTLVELALDNSKGDIKLFSKEPRAHLITSEIMSFDSNPMKKMFIEDFVDFWSVHAEVCDVLLGNQALVASLREELFDAAVVDFFFGECGHALAHHGLGLPVVGYWGFTPAGAMMDYTEAASMPSYVPTSLSGLPDKMTFAQRTSNLVEKALWSIFNEYHFYRCNSIIRRYHPDFEGLGKAWREISGLLLDRIQMFGFPRLLPPNFVHILGSGLVRDPPALTRDLSKFVEGADHGLVVFSMGFSMGINIPTHLFNSMMSAFSKLPQRVVFKGSTAHATNGSEPEVPPNVLLMDKIPQQSLLAHDKTVLFITHCGVNGAIEGIFHRVPMVGLPVDFDQPDNMAFLKDRGAAEQIYPHDDDTRILRTLKKVIGGKGYKEAVGQLADLLAMERHSPLDNAVWLLEYVSRTKGAEHLKMASRNLNLLQYFCIDVLVFLIIVCAIIGIALRKFFRELVPWISQRKYVVPIKIPFIIAFATAVHYINKHVQLL